MTLKSFKPYTKSMRTTILVDKNDLWKGKPEKKLVSLRTRSSGRNNQAVSHLDIRAQVIKKNIG